jgi:polyisoprenoid-binding protein YceI
VSFDGDKPATIEGELTIKGVTKPVTLKVNHFATMPHPMLKKDAIGANASTVIKRSEFNAGNSAPSRLQRPPLATSNTQSSSRSRSSRTS